MNWISNVVPPKIRSFLRRETPENLWVKCPDSGELVFHKDLEHNLHVVPGSGFHMKFPVKQRLDSLFDDARYEDIPTPDVPQDPLKFRDMKRYTDRLKEYRTKTGSPDAIRLAAGTIEGVEVVVAVQNFDFAGGSLGMAAGEAIITGMTAAIDRRTPFIIFTASGGARMQEGMFSLMQMPRTTLLVQRLRAAKLPYIVVLTNPTTGGVTASYAMLGDVHIAEPGAVIGFAGARVIEQTIRERLPEGFQRAEYLQAHGMVDMVVPRKDMRATLARLCALFTHTLQDTVRRAIRRSPIQQQYLRAQGRVSNHEAPHIVGPKSPSNGLESTSFGMNRTVKTKPAAGSDAILERLSALHPKKIDLSLDRILVLLDRLGRPQDQPAAGHPCRRHQRQGLHHRLPAGDAGGGRQERPRLHVAASRALPRAHPPRRTRAAAASSTKGCCSPAALETCEQVNDGVPITLFEMTTAAAFKLFADHRGRRPAARGRARRSLRRDQRDRQPARHHRHARVDGSRRIPRRHGREDRPRKGRHLQARRARRSSASRPTRRPSVLEREARRAGAPLIMAGRDFSVREEHGRMLFEDA